MTSNIIDDETNDVMDEDYQRMNISEYIPIISNELKDSYKRPQSMKREKSHTDSIEREKKRVKFSVNYIEYSNDKVRPGRLNQKLCRPAKNSEKGILKNKYIHVDQNCDKNWSSVPPLNKYELQNSQTQKVSSKTEENCEIQRQNTFTKEEEESSNCSKELNKEIIKKNNSKGNESNQIPDSSQTSQPFKAQYYIRTSESSKVQDSTKTLEQSKLRNYTRAQRITKIKEPLLKKERSEIKPNKSELTPTIIDAKHRQGSPRFKRVLPNQKEEDEKDLNVKRKKYLKATDQTSNNRNMDIKNNNKETLPERKRECLKHSISSCSINTREHERIQDVQILRDQIKITEEKLKEKSIRERDLIQQQKSLKEQFDLATSKIIRNNKREAAAMLSELKAKERNLSKLEKALNKQMGETKWKNNSIVQNEQAQNHFTPRPSLTRSVSAAAAIGRRVKPQISKLNKSLNKDENSTKPQSVTRRDDLIGKKSGAQKRYVSKLEQMRKQIEDQQREIASLNERLREQNPNLKSLSQLSASVPTVYDPEKDERASRLTSRCPCGLNESKDSSTPFMSSYTPVSCHAESSMNYDKETDLTSTNSTMPNYDATNSTMPNYDETRCKSLDLFNMKRASKEHAQPFHYSSLISLNGNKRESELIEENELLRAELQETRDHAELLEFRILEFTEGIQRATSAVNTTCDQSTNTCADDVTTAPPPISEDLSLPLSVDSGLELSVDFNKSRLSEYRKSLSKLEEASGYNESLSVNHLSSLLDWISSISTSNQYESIMSPRSPTQKKMGVSSALEDHRIEDALGEHDLNMLATKLQESLSNPKMQEEVLEETINKLRLINTSLARLHARVNSLTQENKELQEALNVLHESHETRTEASGTESELVIGKSPSLHSDISDSESDELPRPAKSNIIETSVSFQESGIFESSCEMANAATQTYQESDECLVTAVEGEKVTLCKIEYDSIVATERSLQREIEMLQYEKDQISLQCTALEVKLQQNTNRDDASEVLRAQVRLLEERLETSDRQKRLYFDEKCELEEAENDARLLSQRLESQLEAAREMESLLSASLSQEQEFCRELQRRVREMHAIDKGRRMHEEILEKESQFYRRREAALMVENDSQKSQLTFVLYGLILTQFWRRYAANNNKAIVPYSTSVENSLLMDLSEFSAEASFVPTFPCVSECEKCLNSNSVELSDTFTQTAKSEFAEEDMETFVDGQSDKIQTKFNENGLSEREEYYLSQIETLQKERKALREDYENEQSILYEQLQNMKSDLERLQENLDESQRDKCKLIFKLEEAQTVINSSEIELDKQAKELKREFNKSVEAYQQEQKVLQGQYEERIRELRRNVEIHEQRFGALLQQYSVLQHELEPYFQNASDGDEYSSDGGGSSSKIITTKDLLSAVRELVRSELSARQKLNELEKKESAYRETINEADRIMSGHVNMYTRRIEELEGLLEQKISRIKQLETSEERLRTTMKSNWKSSEGTRITELLDRLIETENSELNLKERVWNLERNGKELQIKFVEAEKAQEQLRSELRDQEELVQRLMALSTENNALTTQLQEAHEAARRASDIQQSENYLKSRVDEMEQSENSLRDTLKQAEHIMKQRERKFKDQLSSLEGEITLMKGQLEARAADSEKAKDVETSLRQQIDNFKGQINNLEKDLKESSSENICHETQHRSEVTKLRSQLKLANSQLTDLDTLNGELKERFEAAEAAMKEVAMQLEERSQRYEKEVLSLNLQLAQKDSRLEEYEVQMQHYSHPNVARELDYLATSPLVHLQQALDTFINNMQNCQMCRNKNNQGNCYQTLTDCLKTLNELINGRISQSDSESEDFEPPRRENFGNEPSTTSPPAPTEEGFNENLSGEGETSSVYSLTLTNESGTDTGDKSSVQSLPMVPPRPRRDAKKKKKMRKSNKNEASLLDELEESTSIENGSFYGQFPPSVAVLEELEAKVRELEEVIARKDEELRLADEEANDLQSRLMEEDEKLSAKTEEACKSNEAIITLRQQLLLTVEEYEKARHQLEVKHKVDMNALSKRIGKLTEDLLRLTRNAHIKDKIIDTLVKQIRSILRSSSTTIVVNQIRQISKDFKHDGKQSKSLETDLEIVDFDVDKVCEMLEQTIEEHEVSAELESSSPSQLEVLTYQSLPSLTSVELAKVVKKSRSASDAVSNKRLVGVARDALDRTKACLTPRNLPPLDQNKKSRIPRFRPFSGQSLKHDDYLLHKEFSAKSILKRNKSVPPTEVPVKPIEVKQELKPLAKVVPKQRPMAKVTPKPKTPVEDAPSKLLSDARKIKRMVTGLAPLNACVDCSAAPEFKSHPRPPVPSCVPRPVDLRITRRVGIDGAVIAWKPLEHDCVSGFQVIVGGRVVQQVRSPHRTKALVTGLPFPSPFTIGLVTVAQDGRCSTPAIVTYDKPNTYKTKAPQKASSSINSTNVTPKRAVPTCL